MSYPDIKLFRDEEFEEVKLTPEKVVCLGMEFESDDARRAYFREELRKKLPELRKIEGFPIGEDEDIINLSHGSKVVGNGAFICHNIDVQVAFFNIGTGGKGVFIKGDGVILHLRSLARCKVPCLAKHTLNHTVTEIDNLRIRKTFQLS